MSSHFILTFMKEVKEMLSSNFYNVSKVSFIQVYIK